MPCDFDEVREALTRRLAASGGERNLIYSKGWKAWRNEFITSTEDKKAFPAKLPPNKWQEAPLGGRARWTSTAHFIGAPPCPPLPGVTPTPSTPAAACTCPPGTAPRHSTTTPTSRRAPSPSSATWCCSRTTSAATPCSGSARAAGALRGGARRGRRVRSRRCAAVAERRVRRGGGARRQVHDHGHAQREHFVGLHLEAFGPTRHWHREPGARAPTPSIPGASALHTTGRAAGAAGRGGRGNTPRVFYRFTTATTSVCSSPPSLCIRSSALSRRERAGETQIIRSIASRLMVQHERRLTCTLRHAG